MTHQNVQFVIPMNLEPKLLMDQIVIVTVNLATLKLIKFAKYVIQLGNKINCIL